MCHVEMRNSSSFFSQLLFANSNFVRRSYTGNLSFLRCCIPRHRCFHHGVLESVISCSTNIGRAFSDVAPVIVASAAGVVLPSSRLVYLSALVDFFTVTEFNFPNSDLRSSRFSVALAWSELYMMTSLVSNRNRKKITTEFCITGGKWRNEEKGKKSTSKLKKKSKLVIQCYD